MEQQHPTRREELEAELAALKVAERDALRAEGTRASLTPDGRLVVGRGPHRRAWLARRSDARRARRAAARETGPTTVGGTFLEAVDRAGGYDALDDRGREHVDAAVAMYEARRPKPRELTPEQQARRADRAAARELGYRRLDDFYAAARRVEATGDPS